MAVEVQEVLDDVEVVNTFEVTAYVPKYTICGDDIYIAGYTTNPPQWLLDTIDNSINNSNLADEISDLDVRFQNFQDGYTQKIGYLENQDNAMAFDISTLKVSNDTNTAGIQRLDSTKITANDAQAISEAVIGAWSNTTGGAWFNSKVSAVSNVAYSAARSASNLTAVMNSQQDQMNAIVGDITILQKQVDGKVETWFSLDKPVLADGSVDVTKEPYATWLANNELAIHTGDTYIHYELDVNGNKKILGTYKFVAGTTEDTYVWSIFTDDLASTAYAAALQAQTTADGKIVTYYQPNMPIGSYGDLWIDSDDSDKMYRHNGTTWVEVSDKRIQASVTRLDEATVTVDGEARAKSSLKVDANGKIAGYVAESGSTSEFSIYADKFKIARFDNGQEVGAPFVVDTVTNKIKFTGSVSFAGTEVDTALQQGEAANDINSGVTTIDGGKINTGSITANQIGAQAITAEKIKVGAGIVDGYVQSSNYNLASGTGFKLDALGTSYDRPTIFGAYIRGGTINGSTIQGTNFIIENLKFASGTYPNNTANVLVFWQSSITDTDHRSYRYTPAKLFVGRSYGSGVMSNRIVASPNLFQIDYTMKYDVSNSLWFASAGIEYSADGGAWTEVLIFRSGDETWSNARSGKIFVSMPFTNTLQVRLKAFMTGDYNYISLNATIMCYNFNHD